MQLRREAAGGSLHAMGCMQFEACQIDRQSKHALWRWPTAPRFWCRQRHWGRVRGIAALPAVQDIGMGSSIEIGLNK